MNNENKILINNGTEFNPSLFTPIYNDKDKIDEFIKQNIYFVHEIIPICDWRNVVNAFGQSEEEGFYTTRDNCVDISCDIYYDCLQLEFETIGQ